MFRILIDLRIGSEGLAQQNGLTARPSLCQLMKDGVNYCVFVAPVRA